MRAMVSVVMRALWPYMTEVPPRFEYVLTAALDKALRSVGNPIVQITRAVMEYRLYEDAEIEGTVAGSATQVEDARKACEERLAALHPVVCFLREQRRAAIQRAFEQQEAVIDRRPPELPPEVPIVFASKNEEDDALWPEEKVEAHKKRMMRLAAKRRRKAKQ